MESSTVCSVPPLRRRTGQGPVPIGRCGREGFVVDLFTGCRVDYRKGVRLCVGVNADDVAEVLGNDHLVPPPFDY